jgi:hypothetical protein
MSRFLQERARHGGDDGIDSSIYSYIAFSSISDVGPGHLSFAGRDSCRADCHGCDRDCDSVPYAWARICRPRDLSRRVLDSDYDSA